MLKTTLFVFVLGAVLFFLILGPANKYDFPYKKAIIERGVLLQDQLTRTTLDFLDAIGDWTQSDDEMTTHYDEEIAYRIYQMEEEQKRVPEPYFLKQIEIGARGQGSSEELRAEIAEIDAEIERIEAAINKQTSGAEAPASQPIVHEKRVLNTRQSIEQEHQFDRWWNQVKREKSLRA